MDSLPTGFEHSGSILRRIDTDLIVSKQKLRKAGTIQLVRDRRESANQKLGFASRPFVLCGLPVRQPTNGSLIHERRNGHFVLQVTGHPSYGMPWGQDRLVPIFLATIAVRKQSRTITFSSAAEMLDSFGMQQGGSQYRRLIGAFQRIFGATIFFGTDMQRERATVINQARFNFMSEARIGYARDPQQVNLPGECQNTIVLTEEFYREIHTHPIPMDLEASQLGNVAYSRPRKFREKVEQWLDLVRTLWPECPWRISSDGSALIVAPASAILRCGGEYASA